MAPACLATEAPAAEVEPVTGLRKHRTAERERVFESDAATADARATAVELREVDAKLTAVRPTPRVAPGRAVAQDQRVARKFEVMRDPALTAQARSWRSHRT